MVLYNIYLLNLLDNLENILVNGNSQWGSVEMTLPVHYNMYPIWKLCILGLDLINLLNMGWYSVVNKYYLF